MLTHHSLPPEITIYTVGELRTQCMNWLSERQPEATPCEDTLVIDGSAVRDIDAAGLQVLLALARALERDRRVLRVLQPSAALAEACDMLGVADWITGESTMEDAA